MSSRNLWLPVRAQSVRSDDKTTSLSIIGITSERGFVVHCCKAKKLFLNFYLRLHGLRHFYFCWFSVHGLLFRFCFYNSVFYPCCSAENSRGFLIPALVNGFLAFGNELLLSLLHSFNLVVFHINYLTTTTLAKFGSINAARWHFHFFCLGEHLLELAHFL